jgi:type IV fimbrial biogenesis protein FimT
MNSSKLFQRGVTLIEAGITTSVVAIAATLGVPSFTQMRDTRALEGVSAELGHDLQYVRSEAVARNVSLRLTTQSLAGGGACYVIHTGSAGDCACAADGNATCADGEQSVKTAVFGTAERVGITVNSVSMLWHPDRGTVTPTGTLRLRLPDGRAVHHVVNITGRARTCSPQGSMKGFAVC